MPPLMAPRRSSSPTPGANQKEGETHNAHHHNNPRSSPANPNSYGPSSAGSIQAKRDCEQTILQPPIPDAPLPQPLESHPKTPRAARRSPELGVAAFAHGPARPEPRVA